MLSKPPISLSLIVISAALANTVFVPAYTQTAEPAAANPPASQAAELTTPADSAASTQPISGGVKKVELTLEDLREVDLDVKRLLSASGHLYDEVSIQPVSIQTMPEVIGRGIIVNIPIGTTPVGPVAPAKKERVDLAMNQIRPVISMFKTDVDEFLEGHKQLDISESTRTKLKPYFDSWVAAVEDASAKLVQLEPLVAKSPYDQPAIAQIAVAMQQDANKLHKSLKKVYDVIRKEAKSK